MKITWLGQAGLLFEHHGVKIMIDPYLSDSVKEVNPKNYRRVPPLADLFEIKPDVMIFTHRHLDHYDPKTVEHFITPDTAVTVLAPTSVWEEIRKTGGENNYVLFNRGTSWTEKGVRFTAVKAEHSDPSPIGVMIEAEDKKYYVTGDTLYNEEIFEDVPKDIYAVFLPVNGVGNNMNMEDAKRFCERVAPLYAVPLHCGMFDSIDMNAFAYENKIVPVIYEEVKI
ncbi:MAG: MBL fold metallo-hydrolase [Ruminococcaceae bacterium]|nr:MBL fold metallo-hydrolase [Oscillospiraceae bacterium]